MKKIRIIDIIVTFFWFSQYIHVPYQAPYLSGTGVSSTLIGLIVGFYGMMQMLCRIPLGVYSDLRSKVKPFICLGTALTTCGSVCRALFPTGTGFLIANLFSGLASTAWISFVIYGTSDSSEDHLDSAGARLIFYNNFGILLAFLFGVLFYDRIGIRVLCMCGAIIGLAGFLLYFRLPNSLKEPVKASGNTPLSVIRRALSYPQLVRCSLSVIFQGGFVAATASSFTSKILNDRGASGFLVGLGSVVYILSAVLSSRINGSRFHHKLGFRRSVVLLFLALTMYGVLVPFLPKPWMIICCQVLVGLGQGWLNAMMMSHAQQGIPEDIHSTAMGIYQASAAAGMFLLPLITGKIFDINGMKAAYFVLAGLTLLTAGFQWFTAEKDA